MAVNRCLSILVLDLFDTAVADVQTLRNRVGEEWGGRNFITLQF